ncbi:hypothetical protein KBI23_11895 [bacterium]|nr:hypothetical protein [bacterium]MBP9808624.1 hypothetical protein [bacterium]
MKFATKSGFCVSAALSIAAALVAVVVNPSKVDAEGRVASNCADLVEFKDPENLLGLQFKYPRSWKAQRRPDKDSLVKISGKTASGTEAEIVVSAVDAPKGLSAQQFSKILDEAFYSKLTGVKKTVFGDVLVGKSARLKGYSQTITFAANGYISGQEYLIIPGKGKIISFVLGAQPWELEPAQAVWKNCLATIDGPSTLFEPVSEREAIALQPRAAEFLRSSGLVSCPLPVVRKPAPKTSLDEKIKAVLPRKEEERFLEIPWQSDLLAARARAQELGKPLFIWIMDGNVLGAT